ncbi:hypothetical protein TELCIR_11065 [Teladorsagia circumcincta]|uniref:Uncharacterized protein n=1 Tax=Teladorsagia circumcincta TaxID=45464 RepID=A0A2G9UAF0_TELCI|nr:hypothetical protein TELCIR_11065 [Teladorsagia circumcincta]
MNYLVNAMKGEALDSLKKFGISGNAYQAAVEHLKFKYGSKELLVPQLVRRLEKTRSGQITHED